MVVGSRVIYSEQSSTLSCPISRFSHGVKKALWRLAEGVATWDEKMHGELR